MRLYSSTYLFLNFIVSFKSFFSRLGKCVLSDSIAYQLKTSTGQSKYKYLAELSVSRRLEMILEDIEREKQILDIEDKINKDVKKSIDDSQKEYYLREKMKAIQSELGIPVKYIGIGETIEDLQKFDSEEFVEALFVE